MEKFEASNKRTVKFIFLTLFFGFMIGSIVREVISIILPTELVVTQFFIKSIWIGWGEVVKIPPDSVQGIVQIIDLGIIKIGTVFSVEISVCSLIGLFISWYFLRYFK